MKRTLIFLFCVALAFLLAFCTPSPTEPDTEDVRAASIVRLCEQSGLSVERADELLDLLGVLGYAGEVLFAYPATDDADRDYYHVWIGERTVDVYFAEDGKVTAIRQSGILVYGDDPDVADRPDDAPIENEPSGQTPTSPPSSDGEDTTDNGSSQAPSDAQPDEPEQPPVEMTLCLDDVSAQVSAGNAAFVQAHGRAGEEYRIKVYLKSGPSTAKGLEEQTADADGGLSWNWKISARTTPGDYRIVIARISDERDALELPFTVLPKAEE